MALVRKSSCIFGCSELGAYMHRFPHPEKRYEIFQKWVSIADKKLTEKNPIKIYKNKMVCDYHFTVHEKMANHRLTHTAIPRLHLEGVILSPAISIQLEHNYCIPRAYTSDSQETSSLLHSDSTVNPTDEGARSLDADVLNQPSTSNTAIPVIKGAWQQFTDGSNPPTISTIEIPSEKGAWQLCSDVLNQPSTSKKVYPGKKDVKTTNLVKYIQAKKEMKKLKTQLRKAKNKQQNYKTRINAIKNALTDISAFEKVTKSMTLAAKTFTGMQFRHGVKKPKGRRYNLDEKVLALSIYKKSPKGYSLFSKYFKLPSPKTLKNLLSNIKISPGINENIFKKLKETVDGLNEQDRLCTLIFDEMSLDTHVLYDSANDVFKGFTSDDELKLANHTLVFMIKGIKKNFKQPVAYYFTQSLKTADLKSILKEVIRNVHRTGLKILCTVCDQGATNVSTINSLVADTKEIFLKAGKEWRNEIFIIDGQKIVPLYDVPHLLKGLRNNLLEKDLKYIDLNDGNKTKIVKWEYFQMLYEADKTCGELKCLYKLTEEHVNKNKLKKMRVKMAAQLFSHSVAVTTDHLVARQKLPEECRQLIPMVLIIDKLFDSLNAGTFHIPNGKIYRGAVKRNSPHHQLWQDAIKFFKSVKFLMKRKDTIRLIETSAPSIKNFIKTIEGMQALWIILNKKYSLDCMLTRNFNQDPVENFFGNIRSLGARNISPNCQAFEGAFKTLLLNNYSCRQSINANCEEDFNECLQTLQFLLKENKKICNQDKQQNIEISEKMYEALSNAPTTSDDFVASKRYVCGWVLTMCLKKVVKNCKNCRATLIASKYNKDNDYIRAKEYNVTKQWLLYPSDQLANSFNEVQEITTNFLKTNFQKSGLKENLKCLINAFVAFPFQCSTHKKDLQDYFIETTTNVLIFSWCRSVNRILSGKITYIESDDPIKLRAQSYFNTHRQKK